MHKRKLLPRKSIPLASNVGKGYERIINKRVKEKLHETKAQAGGKARSFMADHIIILKQEIKEKYKNGKTTYTIFTDLQKTYCNTTEGGATVNGKWVNTSVVVPMGSVAWHCVTIWPSSLRVRLFCGWELWCLMDGTIRANEHSFPWQPVLFT